MVVFENVSVVFGVGTPLQTKALRDISLTIADNEFITVIGSNGSGKSTLLNALSGTCSVTQGSIFIDGKDVTRMPSYKRARYIARVFQDPLLGTCDALTIEENFAVALSRGSRRMLKPAIRSADRRRFREILARLNLGLEDRLQSVIGMLSGGQRQAVSLLMATLSPMKILLLDEHTAALDPKTAEFVINLTKEIVEGQRLTTLMVTHSMSQALSVGTRTSMLHQGKVIFDVSGSVRAGLGVSDLLKKFADTQGEILDNDNLLLSSVQ